MESITVSPLGFLARLQLQAASLTLQSRRPPGGICWLWPFPFDPDVLFRGLCQEASAKLSWLS